MEPPPDEADEQGAAIGGNTTRSAVETGFIESDAGLLVGTTAAFPTSGVGARLIGTESNRADPSSNTSGPGHDQLPFLCRGKLQCVVSSDGAALLDNLCQHVNDMELRLREFETEEGIVRRRQLVSEDPPTTELVCRGKGINYWPNPMSLKTIDSNASSDGTTKFVALMGQPKDVRSAKK